jgi:hypothetical protein
MGVGGLTNNGVFAVGWLLASPIGIDAGPADF